MAIGTGRSASARRARVGAGERLEATEARRRSLNVAIVAIVADRPPRLDLVDLNLLGGHLALKLIRA